MEKQKESTRNSKSIFESSAPMNPKMWKPLDSLMEFSHNQKVHSTMKQTPFYLMMGYEPKDILLAFDKTNTPTAEQ